MNKLIEALEFYANKDNWQAVETGIGMSPSDAEMDCGARARGVLEILKAGIHWSGLENSDHDLSVLYNDTWYDVVYRFDTTWVAYADNEEIGVFSTRDEGQRFVEQTILGGL